MLEQSPPADSPPVVPEERRRLIVAMLGTLMTAATFRYPGPLAISVAQR